MNKLMAVLLAIVVLAACEKNAGSSPTGQIGIAQKACGSDMRWLENMIAKAEEDRKTRKYLGAYLGTIYLTKHNNRPVFMIDMMLNSGGLMFHAFDCDSQRVVIPDINFYSDTKQRGTVIYSNFP
jgi:hypothetical protein